MEHVGEVQGLRVRGVPHEEIEEIIALAGGDAGRLRRLALRKRFGEPNAYLRGTVTMLGREFNIDRRVYIPDQGAELLARMLIDEAAPNASVLEVGTGSGWMSVCTKLERPDLTVSAADIHPAALAVARENAERHGVKIDLYESCFVYDVDILPPDYIIANLPYGGDANYTARELEERPQMPSIALFDPEGVIKPLEEFVRSVLSRGWRPILYMETGYLEERRFMPVIPPGAPWRHIVDGEYAVVVLDLRGLTEVEG